MKMFADKASISSESCGNNIFKDLDLGEYERFVKEDEREKLLHKKVAGLPLQKQPG